MYAANIKQLEGEYQPYTFSSKADSRSITQTLESRHAQALENLDWLFAEMPAYFFITMGIEVDAIARLALGLQNLDKERELFLVNQDKKMIIARLDVPGSFYDTLKYLRGREISYAEITHSLHPVARTDKNLEILRFELNQKSHEEIRESREVKVPGRIKSQVLSSMKSLHPELPLKELQEDIKLFWVNNEDYVRFSPSERVARIIWLYRQCLKHEGLFFHVEPAGQVLGRQEQRVLFAVENPPEKDFLAQIMEISKRLGFNVRRSYCLNLSNGHHWYFLGNFYVAAYHDIPFEPDSDIFGRLRMELYNTQILSSTSGAYPVWVTPGIMTGEEASLINAMCEFCHTSLAHCEPDRFSSESVKDALFSHPTMALSLLKLFKLRFDPEEKERKEKYEETLKDLKATIETYNTGHKHLDEIRRFVYRTCLLFVTHTLKTNFFVTEKQALSFRLDPAYLTALGPEFSKNLPARAPFRVTFLYSRRGLGYHIGFSDIARGGWRTIICRSNDALTTNTNNLFREVYVLAHTQHLKNKDIYEGGSKLTVTLKAVDLDSAETVTKHLHKLQYAMINAFLDIMVTENGKAKDPRVLDYYGEDEPIELGPDENLHDAMIETIARQAVKRGYLLGAGIISSKHAGINHKQYGVTSRGVYKSVSIAMKEVGIDVARDVFTIKMTGGPNGDVGGNLIYLLAKHSPQARLIAVTDASGALYDPGGIDWSELVRLVHKGDICDYDPQLLHPGGFMLFGTQTRQESLKRLFRKVVRLDSGLTENWITLDEFHKALDELLFSLSADVFVPCGGRPETIDGENWQKMFSEGRSSVRVIVEGANSFLSPDARVGVQKRGVVILRDASANKCGVISSSYEIIANLLLTDKELLNSKEDYVKSVFEILDRRVEDEANLIFKRHRESEGKLLYTEISAAISEEINQHYDELFAFFKTCEEPLQKGPLRNALLSHLPAFIRDNPRYSARIRKLPPKIVSAILASEIAASIVYRGGWGEDLEAKLERFLACHYRAKEDRLSPMDS